MIAYMTASHPVRVRGLKRKETYAFFFEIKFWNKLKVYFFTIPSIILLIDINS